ncbi:MAG: Ig-like domain-containing protein [Neomegalonema sp.]|nr:Ig-like domain-containing protein [Neomegalonema sp.]
MALSYNEMLDVAINTAKLIVAGQSTKTDSVADDPSGGWNYTALLTGFDGTQNPFEYQNAIDTTGVAELDPRDNTWSTLDDDNTQQNIRFLAAVRAALPTDHADYGWIDAAYTLAVDSLLERQADHGGFRQSYFDGTPFSAETLDEDDYRNNYDLNDSFSISIVYTLDFLHQATGEQRYLDAMQDFGNFLLATQGSTQAGWAQSYDYTDMDAGTVTIDAGRSFEPAAYSALATSTAARSLLSISMELGSSSYLDEVEDAINWLNGVDISTNTWARFYELGTNRRMFPFRTTSGEGYVDPATLDALASQPNPNVFKQTDDQGEDHYYTTSYSTWVQLTGGDIGYNVRDTYDIDDLIEANTFYTANSVAEFEAQYEWRASVLEADGDAAAATLAAEYTNAIAAGSIDYEDNNAAYDTFIDYFVQSYGANFANGAFEPAQPVVAVAIADLEIDTGADMDFSIAGTFFDADGDALTLTATLADGSPLPSWLVFDPATQSFAADPGSNDFGSYNVTVRATEASSAFAQETFKITVNDSVVPDIDPGDIAFIGYNSDSPSGSNLGDAFGFVALVEIPAGTRIKFTENGTLANGDLLSGERTITWSSPGIAAGTVVTFESLNADGSSIAVSTGSVDADDRMLDLSAAGDQVLAYVGPTASPVFIAALNMNDADADGDGSPDGNQFGTEFIGTETSRGSELPTGLTLGLHALGIVPEVDNAYYTGTTSFASQAEALAALNDPANWSSDDANAVALSNWVSAVSLDGVAAPEIDVQGGATPTSILDGDTTPSEAEGTDFGTTAAQAVTQSFTIRNTGSVDLMISDLRLGGADAADFSISGLTSSVIAAGGSASFDVSFTPSADGARNAQVIVESDDGDESLYDFDIVGTGDFTAPSLSATSPADGAVDIDANAAITLTFDEPIVAGTGNIRLETAAGSLIESFDPDAGGTSVTLSGSQITLTPSNPLPEGEDVRVVLETGAVLDMYGNAIDESGGGGAFTFSVEGGSTPVSTGVVIVSGQSLMGDWFQDSGSAHSAIDGVVTTLSIAELSSLTGYDLANRIADGDTTVSDNGDGTVTLNNLLGADRLAIELKERYGAAYEDIVIVRAASGGKAVLGGSSGDNFFNSDASGSINAVGDGTGSFDGGLMTNFVKPEIDDAVSGLTDAELIGVTWAQGEADDPDLDANDEGTSADNDIEALYKNGVKYTLNEIINYTLDTYSSQFSAQSVTPTAYIQHIGGRNGQDNGIDDVKTIQEELAAEESNIVIATESYDLEREDSVHPTGESYHILVERMAAFIADGESGPRVTNVALSSDDTADVATVTLTLSFPSGFSISDLDLGPNPEKYLTVFDESTDDGDGRDFEEDPIPVTNVQISGNTLIFTLGRALDGDGSVVFAYSNTNTTDSSAQDVINIDNPGDGLNGDLDQPLYGFRQDFTAADYTGPDTIAPTLASSSPADDFTLAPAAGDIVLTFSEAVQAGTGNIELRLASDDSVISASVSFNGSSVTINPDADLIEGEGYYVLVETDAVQDLSGNFFAGITDTTTLNFSVSAAAGPLAPGAIAFVAYSSDDDTITDGFAFVAVEDIPAGAEINFTDNGWDGSSFVGSEDAFTWTSTGIAAGTVVTVDRDGATINVSAGTVTGGSRLAFSTSGDQVLAYTGTEAAPSFIAAINMNGAFGLESDATKGSLVPTGLTEGTHALALDPEVDNGYYSGSTFFTSTSEALAAINDPANWTSSDSFIDPASWQTSAYTIMGTDVIAPSLISTSPLDDEAAFDGTADIVLTFDEAVQAGTGSIRLVDTASGQDVAASVTFNGTTVTIDPTADLAGNAAYHVIVESDAVTDAAGNAFGGLTDPADLNFTVFEAISYTAGDIAFIGYNSDDTDPGRDAFGFVSLVDIPAGQTIKFTDSGVTGGVLDNDESTLTWTSPGITANTVVTFSRTSGGDQVVDLGTVSGDVINFSTSGDQIIAYQGSAASPNYLAALIMDIGNSDSEVPPGLVEGLTALSIDPEVNNAYYSGPTTLVGRDTTLSTIHDAANWTSSDGTAFDPSLWASGFDITLAQLPEIDVLGGTPSLSIVDGDVTPGLADGTEFGTVTAAGAVQTYTISNDGTADLSITSVVASGTDAGDFVIAGFTSGVIAAGGSETFTVTFTPAAEGLRSASIEIVSDDADEALYDFAIQGTGDVTAPTLLSTEPLDDAVDVAITSNITLTFSENVAAGTGAIAIYNAADDTLVETIAANSASVSINGAVVTVDPVADLAQSSGFYVQVDATAFTDLAGNPFAGITDTTSLSFTTGALPAEIDVLGGLTALSIVDGDVTPDLTDGTDFGLVGVAGSSQTYTISNDGLGDLSITSIGVTGAAASDFAVTGFTTGVIAPGTSQTFTVTFTPSADGLATAGIEIISNDGDEALYDFAIQANGKLSAPTLVSTAPLDDAVDVTISADIVLTFDTEMQAAEGGFIYVHAADGSVIEALRATSGRVFFDGTTVTVDPVNNLGFSTDYYITVDANAVQDLAGNAFAGFTDPTLLNFTTAAQPVGPLFEETFETDGLGSRYTVSSTFTDLDDDYFTRTDGSDIDTKNDAGYLGKEGTYFWAGEDLDGENPTDVEWMQFSQVNTVGAGEMTFTGLFGVGNTNGVDASAYDDRDYLAVLYSTDGGSTYQVGLLFRAIDGSGNQPFALVSTPSFVGTEAEVSDALRDLDGDGDADIRRHVTNFGDSDQVLSNTLQEFSFTIPEADTVDIIIASHMDGGDEEFAFDSLRITSNGPVIPVPEITLLGSDGLTEIVDGDAVPDLADGTDFGSTGLVGGSVQTYTIRNDGTAALNVSALSITGVDAGDFAVTGFTSGTIAAGASETFTVTFTPGATGLRSASIEILSDDADEAVYDFAIQGTGDVTAPLLLATSPVDDASGVAFNTALSLTFDEAVIASTGSVRIIDTLTGAEIAALPAAGANVGIEGGTVTVTLPSDLAFDTAYHVLIDTDAFTDGAGNAFTGISDPAAFNFTTGSQPVGPLFEESFETDGLGTRYTVSSTFTDLDDDYFVRTDGSDIDTKNDAGYQGITDSYFWAGEDLDGENPTDLEWIRFNQINTAGVGSLTFSGDFGTGNTNGLGANAFDDRDYVGVFYSTDGGGTWQVGLLFRSADNNGDIANEPLALVENPSFIGSETAAAAELIDLDGNGDVDIRDFVSTSGSSSQTLSNTLTTFSFDIPEANTLDIIIAAHADGGDEEFAFDNLKIESAGPVTPVPEIAIEGGATPTEIVDGDTTPDAGDGTIYGSVAAGNTAQQSYSIENSGTAPLEITSIVITGDAQADFVVSGFSSGTIPAGSSASFTVTFSPSATGTRSATVQVFSNDADEAVYDFAIEGTGDVTAPSLISSIPADDAADIAIAANIELSFDEPVAKGAGTISVFTQAGALVEAIDVASAQVSVSGSSVTIDPTDPLAFSTGYYVTVDAGAFTDLAGNAFGGISDPAALNFTTEATDIIAPSLVSTSPVDDATDVAADANITLTFDEPIAEGTGSVVIRLVADDSAVETLSVPSASVSVSGDTVTINPVADLDPGTAYYVEISNGAFTDGAGNPFAGIADKTVLNFTTELDNPGGTGLPSIPTYDPADAISGLVGSDGVDDLIVGTESSEKLDGKSGNDMLFAVGGDDTLRGRDGDDILVGGAGSDNAEGDDGNDTLFGEGGNDKLKGRAGNDILIGGQGDDRLFGDEGDDTLGFGDGADDVEGGSGSDLFVFTGDGAGSHIADFNTAEGDALDISSVITGTGPAINFVRLVSSGSTVTVQINADGQGSDFVDAFSFEGDATSKDVTTLVNDGDLIL